MVIAISFAVAVDVMEFTEPTWLLFWLAASDADVLGGPLAGSVSLVGEKHPTQSVEVTQVLEIVNFVVEKDVAHLEEGARGEETVTAGLMLRTDPLHAQIVGHILQPALQILTTLHQIFDVVNAWKKQIQQSKKLRFTRRQRATRQQLEQVAEIVATSTPLNPHTSHCPPVKGDPLDVAQQHHATGNHQLGKFFHVDSLVFVFFKLNPSFRQQINGVLSVQVVPESAECMSGQLRGEST